jgi:5-formyltetrahydrofolate cyclo-ligase
MQRHFREIFSGPSRSMSADFSNSPNRRRELRAFFRSQRRQLPVSSQLQHARAVARHLRTSGLLWRRGCIAAYLPNHAEGELDCIPIMQALWSMNRRVVLPVVGKQRGFMALYHYQPDTRLVTNRYGIAEPESGSPNAHRLACALMLVPLVAFDEHGGRLGMGGGYYDRFLGNLPTLLRPRLVGLAHEVQRSNTLLPKDSWDIPLDDIVTEAGWQSFRADAQVSR